MRTKLNVNGQPGGRRGTPTRPCCGYSGISWKLTGTKYGCGAAYCGACTIYVDGEPTRSCQTPVSAVAGKAVTTIEALEASDPDLVQVWEANNVPQCGYCQSGQLMSAAALLARNDSPSDADIDAAMTGNICRCGTYIRIRAAIHEVAEARRQAGGEDEA